MGEERKRQSLADTLRATSPIAGLALASTASAIRLISAPQEAMPEAASTDVPHSKAKPVVRSDIKPLSQPLNPSLSHSASHSASLSLAPSQDPSLSQSLSLSCVADRLTKYQRDILSYLLATRPYIIRYAQLGQAVGLGEATTRTILRRLAALDFIKFQRLRDGQIQGVSISFNASLCEQFTQGQSLSQSLSQPVIKPLSKPLASKKMDLEEEINPSEAVAEKLAKLTDKQIAMNWPELAAKGFRSHDLRRILKNLALLGLTDAYLVEGLSHGDYELHALRKGKTPLRKASGELVRDPYAYVVGALFKSGVYRRPEGYVSPAEQAEKDAEEEARRFAEAHKKREEAEFQAWCGGLTYEEKSAIFQEYNGDFASEEVRLKVAWKKRTEKAQRTAFDEGGSSQIKAQSAQTPPS